MKKTLLILLLIGAIFAGCAEKKYEASTAKPAMQPGPELAAKQIEAESVNISAEVAEIKSMTTDVEDLQINEEDLGV